MACRLVQVEIDAEQEVERLEGALEIPMARPRIITLCTDFGLRDNFVGQMKGAALAVDPGLRSGLTLSRRKAPDITSENTGAATSPP